MKNININLSIRLLCILIRYGIILSIGSLLGKIVWWAVNPLDYNTFNNIISSSSKSDTLAQGIVNRAPFGVVTQEKAPEPTIKDQVKVLGVYAGGPNNSIAFIQVNGKNDIAVIGDSVLNAKIKTITPDGIVLIADNQDVKINISSGNSKPSENNSSAAYVNKNDRPNSAANNSYIPNVNARQIRDNNRFEREQEEKRYRRNAPQNEELIMEQRRKMIEEFQRQNAEHSNTNSDNNNNNDSNDRN